LGATWRLCCFRETCQRLAKPCGASQRLTVGTFTGAHCPKDHALAISHHKHAQRADFKTSANLEAVHNLETPT
jgi:hypothetical protein